MKKIFTSCAVLIYGLTLAQGPVKPLMAPKKVDNVVNDPGQVGHGTGASNRVTAFTNDFSTPSDWTMTNNSSPAQDWEIVNALPSGLTSQNFGPTVNSTSGGNFALINSDGAGGTATQDANITTTNSFDCSGNPSVQVRFENYHRIFQEQHFVQISTDGVNFTSYEVNTNYGANNNNYVTSPNVEEISINVSATAAAQPAVWLRFNYNGAYDWFWVIDDITVEDAPADNMTLTGAKMWDNTWEPIMGVRLDHYVVPMNLVDDQIIGGTINNLGSTDNTNAAFTYSASNSVPAVVGSGSTTPATLAVGASLTDSLTWNTNTAIESYDVTIAGTHDNIGTNASQSYTSSRSYEVVASSGAGSQYARDNNTATGSGLWNGSGNGYIMGNSFYVNTTTTIYSIDVAFTASTDPGVVACIILYEMDPNGSSAADIFIPVVDQCLDGVERTLDANSVSTATTMNWQAFPINAAAPLTGYTLTAGKSYVAAINHYGGTEEMVLQQGGTTVDDYSVWLFDQTDATWYYMTTKPKIRLGMDNTPSFLGVNELEFSNLSLGQNVPNPSNGTATISYSLVESANVSFEVVDLTGKVIYSETMGTKGAGVYSINLNTADYSEGIYFYTMTAGADKITKKMVVTK